MDLKHLAPEHVQRFQAYIPSKPDEELKALYGCPVLHRLNNNENPLGPPPTAQQIIRRFPPPASALYPSGDSYRLRRALAERFGLQPDQILVGNGSCELIGCVTKAFGGPGDNLVTADKTFAVYEWVGTFSGLETRLVPLTDYTFDDAGILQQIDDRTKVIFVCNPNNPTGTYWNCAKLVRFLECVAGRCLVVLDEAYCEYVEHANFPDGLKLIERYPNLIVFRTFSKMYALAGLRIGYLAGSLETVDLIRRVHVAYSVNRLAQEAAQAALVADTEHIRATRLLVQEGKCLLKQGLAELGLTCLCGEGSYAMVQVPVGDSLLYRRLMRRGLMVRTMTGFRFPNWIRVTIVQRDVLQQFLDGLAAELRELTSCTSGFPA